MALTWTYNPAIATDSDRVRLLVGDTNADAPQSDDGEVAFFLSDAGSVYPAAALAAEALAGRAADDVTRALSGPGGLSIQASDRFRHYTALAVQLRARAAQQTPPIPYAGGVSQSDKASVASDPDRVPPAITVGRDLAWPAEGLG